MNTKRQNSRILRHFERGKRLTALDALDKFGCLRLAARVHELRESGHPVESQTIILANGKKVTQYRIDPI